MAYFELQSIILFTSVGPSAVNYLRHTGLSFQFSDQPLFSRTFLAIAQISGLSLKIVGPIADSHHLACQNHIKCKDRENQTSTASQHHHALTSRMHWRTSSACPIGLVFNDSGYIADLPHRGLMQYSTRNMTESSEPLCLITLPEMKHRLSTSKERYYGNLSSRIHLTLPLDEPVSPSFSFLLEQKLLKFKKGKFPLLEIAIHQHKCSSAEKQRRLDMRPLLPLVITH